MFISCPGYIKNVHSGSSFLIDRWMITTGIDMDCFRMIIESNGLFLIKSKTKYFLKNGFKALLGENRYHRLAIGKMNG
jgi:hypothetical protein